MRSASQWLWLWRIVWLLSVEKVSSILYSGCSVAEYCTSAATANRAAWKWIKTFSHVFCPAPNKCRRGLQRGICAESFLRRVSVFFPPIPWKRSTRNRHRQLKGSLHNRDPPKRFQGQAYKVQPTDWWMTEPGLLRLDWHPCNLPTSKSQCEAGKPWTGWNGHPWHLQCFHAAQFKSWRKMFAYSFVHPPHDWGECVKWGNLSHSDCLKRRCWGWGVWTFWMVTGRALLKVKMRKGTQYCSITRNTEKSSISDDHPTFHRHSFLWLFRWWNASNSLRLRFQLVKYTPSYPAKEQKWMTGKEIQQLRPAKRPARDKHSKATHKVQKKLLRCLFVPFDSNKMTECQLSRGGRCLEYQMTSDLSCSWAIFDPQWLVNRMPLWPWQDVKVNLSTMKNHGPQRALAVQVLVSFFIVTHLINRWVRFVLSCTNKHGKKPVASIILWYDLLSYTLSSPN